MINFALGCKNRAFVLYLKKLIAKKSLKKSFKRPQLPFSVENIQKVGLLLSYDLADNHKAFETMLRSCIPVRAQIYVAFFSEKPIKNPAYDLAFSPKDMRTDGSFEVEALTHFFKRDYDLFITCSNIESPFLNICLRNSKAGLTISNQLNARRCADFVLEVEPFEATLFFTELEKYIKRIHK